MQTCVRFALPAHNNIAQRVNGKRGGSVILIVPTVPVFIVEQGSGTVVLLGIIIFVAAVKRGAGNGNQPLGIGYNGGGGIGSAAFPVKGAYPGPATGWVVFDNLVIRTVRYRF